MKKLLLVAEAGYVLGKSILTIAQGLGLETSSMRPDEAVARVSQEKPDFVLVDCDAQNGVRTIEKLEILESNTKVFGFGFSKQPTEVQQYVRLPILILELASTLNIQTDKGER